MRKNMFITETLFTKIRPEKVSKISEECLVTIRLIESRQEASTWSYEYEVHGEVGKVEKFLKRIRSFELGE